MRKEIKEMMVGRLDYKNPTNKNMLGFPMLPFASSLEEVTDLNEVNSVKLFFETLEAAEAFAKNFPKYCGAVAFNQKYYPGYPNEERPVVLASWNCFWTNKVTGAKNEAAFKARKKFFEILKKENI